MQRSSTAPSGPVQSPGDPSHEVREQVPIADRLRAVDSAIAVLRPLTARNRPALEAIEVEVAGLRENAAASAQDENDQARRAAIAAVEDGILAIDEQISASSYRRMPLAPGMLEQVAQYAGLLARCSSRSLTRLDRVELLVTRVCAVEETDGARAVRPRADVEELLRLVGIEASDQDSRARAVAFFAAASQRLATMANVDAIFAGGLYLDARGYKISLNEQRLDPEVLYAIAAFNVALGERLRFFQQRENIRETELAARFESVDDQIEALFGAAGERGSPVEPPARQERPRTDRVLRARRRRWVPNAFRAAGIALAIAGATLLAIRSRGQSGLSALRTEELKKFSPLLESGSISRGKDSFLLGRIPSSRWFVMSRSERRSAASTLRNHLMRRRINSAVVFRDDDVLAIQIEQGRVLAVE